MFSAHVHLVCAPLVVADAVVLPGEVCALLCRWQTTVQGHREGRSQQ